MRRTPILALLTIAGAWAALHAATARDQSVLQDGQTVERRLDRGDVHRYQLGLEPGEYVSVVVDQRGVDVVAGTRDAAGDSIADFDDEIRNDGAEHVELVADAGGTFTVTIKAVSEPIEPGSYAVRIAARHPAQRRLRPDDAARRDRHRLQPDDAVRLQRPHGATDAPQSGFSSE